jgi:hypothetical protein
MLVRWMHGGRTAAIMNIGLKIQILFRHYAVREELRIIEHFLWGFEFLPTTVDALKMPFPRSIRTKKAVRKPLILPRN